MEIEDKTALIPGFVYIAPSGYHLLFEKDDVLSLDISDKVNHSRPSIDVSFESAADIYRSAIVAVLLSGANSDGTNGLKAIQLAGGTIAIQNPDEAEMSFMPQFAKTHLKVDLVLNAADMPPFINSINAN